MKDKSVTLQFFGAAGTVTGSKFLIRAAGQRILIDCGLFQGLKKLRLLNWKSLPVHPSAIDTVLLTHGHLDHCGYLPKLVKDGFKGMIRATAPTLEVSRIILEDSAKIQEEDAEMANRKGFSKHREAEPLYTLHDVSKTIPLFHEEPLDTWVELCEGIEYRFRYNGHIIGATFIEMNIYGRRFVFSGDIGRENDPLLRDPSRPDRADVLFIESTYGDRLHPTDSDARLTEIIQRAAERKGTVIIPSFAVERTQLLMYKLWQLRKNKAIPEIPVYTDSPMASKILDIFGHNRDWHKLPADEYYAMCRVSTSVSSYADSLKLLEDNNAKIVIAASGMGTGGRVLSYFQKYLSDQNATILLVGYQAEGTRGRQLLDGAPEIKLRGNYYPVYAKVESLQGLSAHADQRELLDWVCCIREKPQHIFIVHGEEQAADAFRVKLKHVYGWDADIPELDQEVTLFAEA